MASENTAKTLYNKWLQTEFAAALAHRLVQAAKNKTPLASSQEAEMIQKCQLMGGERLHWGGCRGQGEVGSPPVREMPAHGYVQLLQIYT